jgi:hypothetical protein
VSHLLSGVGTGGVLTPRKKGRYLVVTREDLEAERGKGGGCLADGIRRAVDERALAEGGGGGGGGRSR